MESACAIQRSDVHCDDQPDSVAIRTRLQAEAHRYFGDLSGDTVHVDLSHVGHNKTSTMYEFQLRGSRQEHAVFVKVRHLWPTLPENSRAVVKPSIDRSWLDWVASGEERSYQEYAALSAVYDSFTRLNDSRLLAVRPLDCFRDVPALISAKLQSDQLKRLFLRQMWRGGARELAALQTAFSHAGAWLREMHRMQPLEYTKTRDTSRDEFIENTRRLVEFLRRVHGRCRFLRSAADRIAAMAQTGLPDQLPTGLLHGDYAPRNVLVDGEGRVAGCDTRACYYGPVYEDIACFLVLLERDSPLFIAAGFGPRSKRTTALREAFLQGYFGDDPVPHEAIRLFELQLTFERWAQGMMGYYQSTGARRLAKRCRLTVLCHLFLGIARRLIEDIQQINGER